MDLLEKIKKFVKELFNVNIETFFAAIKLSPNAQGYLSGAISELLLKEELERYCKPLKEQVTPYEDLLDRLQ